MGAVEDLELMPVWVAPGHLAATALHVLRGHNLRSVAVIDGAEPVGLLTLEGALCADSGQKVAEVMEPPGLTIEAGAGVREVAELFAREGLSAAMILAGGQYRGMLTATTLLRAMGRSWDPMTGLPWSDALREWGVERLRAGDEIGIIFIDLDDFGDYNKRHGHVVGDRIIKRVVALLAEIEDGVDLLARYAGDEFSIGTLLPREEAEALREGIAALGDEVWVEGIEEAVSFSVGLAGGRRTDEREDVHYQATVDNLINLASRDCQARKAAARARERFHIHDGEDAKISVTAVSVSGSKPSSMSTVALKIDGERYVAFDQVGGKPALYSIARATCNALQDAFPDIELEPLEIMLTDEEGGAKVVTASLRGSRAGVERVVGASVPAGSHVFNAAAQAVVDAALDLPLADQ